MPKQYVEEMWEDFCKKAVKIKISEIQRIEMKKSFFAGAVSIFNKLVCDVSEGNEVKESDLQMMSDISNEFQEVCKKLEKGLF